MPAAPRVHHGSAAFEAPDGRPVVVTVGNFDGVHRGHRALIDAARGLAGPSGRVVAYTFDPSPRDVMRPGHGVPRIQSLEDRIRVLGEAGCDDVCVEAFSASFSRIEAEDWCDDILAGRFGAAGVVVGWDFRFGRGRRGDAALLRSRLTVPVRRVEAVSVDGEVVSSTRVRTLVEGGRVAEARTLLTRPHEVVGEVVRGDGRGRTIGVPTANVVVDTELVPAPGVYAVRLRTPDGAWRDGVANHGSRPTVGPTRGRLEVHLFDWTGDLYGARVRVAFLDRLREERRFPDVDALVTQIHQDAAAARRILADTP